MLEPLAKANQSMSRHQTFTKLVTDDKDFVGMVAYTIYKKEKLDWIEQFKVTHGDEPSEAELKQFTLASDSTLRIQQYREIAESRVNDFIDNAIFEELEGYKKRLRDDEIVKASKKGFIKGVGENVLAGIIGAGIVTLFQLGIWLYQVKDNPEFKKQATEQIQQTAN